MMLKHFNPIMEEGGILVLQKLFHSPYNFIILFKMATTKVEFEFRKRKVRWS